MAHETNPTLEEAILANPDDPATFLVYADWLQGRGDPRGELIALHHQSASDADADKRAEFAHRASDYVEKHAEHLLGPLATFTAGKTRKKLTVEWRLGFISSLTLGWGMYDRGGTRKTAKAELAEFLSHPSSRFITSLALGPAPADDQMSLQCLVEAMVETGRPELLRSLELGDTEDWDISSTATGNFGAIAARFKQLREVRLRGGDVTIGDIDLPELRSFTVETGGLTEADLAKICSARWPKLERLDIWFGDPNYGASGGIEDIASILEGRGLGSLKHLGLMNCPWVDTIARALPESKILRQLETLDLSMGALSDEGVAAMAEHLDAFAHLTSLDVTDNALTEASGPVLAQFKPRVESHTQDPDRIDGDFENRYCSVGE